MPGQRLLIVDNDRAFLKEHQAGLEAAFEVEVAPSPDTAMQRLETGSFACVLISVEIADNRGYALCASIRRSSKLSGVKVALISAKATEDEYKRHQSLKGRADLYLMKPVPPINLVEALRPFVPPRGVDPDNPLGDLADDGDLSGDLGGDWLGDLKTDLDAPLAAPPPHAAGTVAISAAQIQAALASAPPPPPSPMPASAHATAPPGTPKPDMAVAQVAHLQEELRAKEQKLRETEDALVQLQRQLNSVTVNLDELERGKKEAASLQAQLAQAQAALEKAEESGDTETLRQQLRDAIAERQQLIQQADQLNQQLSEKTTRTIELLRERDKLQAEALELPGLQAKVAAAEAELAKAKPSLTQLKEEVASLEATVRGQGRQLDKMQDSLSEAEARMKAAEEAKASLAKDVEKAMREATQLRKELDEVKSTHDQERRELMGGLDIKEAELARHKDQLKAAQEAVAALEKEKQGLQGQLADRGDRMKALAALMEELGEKLRQGGGLAKE